MTEESMAQRIRKLRLEQGLTLEQVASKVGVGKSTVRKWETGIIANMRRDKIAALANALQTTPAYLMGWEELVASEAEEARSGRRTAKEEIFRTHGTEHSISSLQLINDKVALLYYKAMERYSASSLLTMIEAVDDLARDDVENISQVVRAYLRADAPIKKIVDTALQPYFPNDNDIGE